MECLFSENLKKFRLEKKISQQKLAELLNISQQCISEWEHGNNQPTLTSLLRLSEVFEISIDELVGKI